MATIAFSTVGTIFGGPIGGAIGAMAGRQFDAAIFGSATRQGPRLKELDVTTSTYGQPIARQFGRMRVAGSIIWATDLVEHSETAGGGKGQPSVRTYSYTANFAVALSSRPISSVGRIWADGKLLRGASGDLKVGGIMRLYTGSGDEAPDPLIAASEGAEICPAFRDLAYVVFEGLDLSEYYNRIPSLTFEVFADDGLTLENLVAPLPDDVVADMPLEGIEGFSREGTAADALQTVSPFFRIDINVGDAMTLGQPVSTIVMLPEPAIATGDGDFGGASGYSRNRAPLSDRSIGSLRYFDVDRDYQPGMQYAGRRASTGQPQSIDFPAALSAATAHALVDRVSRQTDWSRDTMSWRTATLDAGVGPGTLVACPGHTGIWRVNAWEWRDRGVELSLERQMPRAADRPSQLPADSGTIIAPSDLPLAQSGLVAFELPWDGQTGSADSPALFAATSSDGPNWSGAALYADSGDGSLVPLGSSGRVRNIIGAVANVLPPASPLVIDRASRMEVELIAADLHLAPVSIDDLANGANLALVGEELIQFTNARHLGNRRWMISGLLRGRGGTEAAINRHCPNEPFAMIDGRATRLGAATTGFAQEATIVAIGRGDTEVVASPVHLRGIGMTPLSPVHPRVSETTEGGLMLEWTRRARGGWQWRDGVDVPLVEDAERYQVSFEIDGVTIAYWSTDEAHLAISAATRAALASSRPEGHLLVRQSGTHGLSAPLFLTTLF